MICHHPLKTCLNKVEALDYDNAKINKLQLNYLGDILITKVKKPLASNSEVATRPIIVFRENVCFHLNERFPDDELKEWECLDPYTVYY